MTMKQMWNHHANWKFLKEHYERMWVRSCYEVLRNPTDANIKKRDSLELKMDNCEMYRRRCFNYVVK